MVDPLVDGDILPHSTLYVSNLDEKLPKNQLKKMLYLLFIEFGTIEKVLHCTTTRCDSFLPHRVNDKPNHPLICIICSFNLGGMSWGAAMPGAGVGHVYGR